MAATKFNVVLDIPLTKSQTAAINKEIQAVVMKQIALIDNKNELILASKRIPKEWLGIWLKNFNKLSNLNQSKTFIKYKGQ